MTECGRCSGCDGGPSRDDERGSCSGFDGLCGLKLLLLVLAEAELTGDASDSATL